MDRVRVLYHAEDGGWWAESQDLAGWTVVADTYDAVRELVRESVHEFAGEGVAVVEIGVPVRPTIGAQPASGSSGFMVIAGVHTEAALNVVPAGPRPRGVERAEITSDDGLLTGSSA